MPKYRLQSVNTGKVFEDKGWTLDPPGEQEPSLVRAIYEKQQISFGSLQEGIYRFDDWLPTDKRLDGSAAPITYKSKGLADMLGLKNLYITFSGYYPEKNALMKTCSFKETEAYSVCARPGKPEGSILVVASAGNTARAFARVCSENKIPLLLCIPEDNLDALWINSEPNPCVKAIASRSGGDYFDAIHLSNLAVKSPLFVAEGGAKNVARRDGMSTTVLSAVDFIGEIPEYYFQAVGSGTGAIAAWEANLRLIADGRFGNRKMKLMVSQNHPFVPMYNAWKLNSRALGAYDDNLARTHVEEIDAKVLSNRRPPYSIKGGLFDALTDSSGEMFFCSNEEAREAALIFEKLEGIDIHPAAAVATASLINETKSGNLSSDAVIMLNITGGGEKRFKKENEVFHLKASHIFDLNPDEKEVIEVCEKLFS